MKRIVRFNSGIIDGDEMTTVVDILPQLEGNFRQRKTYFEYYFDEQEVELSIEDIDRLSNNFSIKIDYENLTILL